MENAGAPTTQRQPDEFAMLIKQEGLQIKWQNTSFVHAV